MKKCSKCGESKPLDQFHKKPTGKYGVQPWCKSCVSTYNRKRYAADPEKIKGINRKWRDANPEQKRENDRRWWAANRERTRESNLKWRADNREASNIITHRRRARQYANGVFAVTPKEIRRLLAQPCYLCEIAPSTEMDHIIPNSRGGRWSVGNLLGACRSCNSSKNDKLLFEFKVRRRVLP